MENMKEMEEFIANFADVFDDTDPEEINADTVFHELEEWSSLTGMTIIAMARTQYGKTITGPELRACVTVEDVYKLISEK